MLSPCCIFQQSVRFTAPRKHVSLWGSRTGKDAVLPGYCPGNSVTNRNWGKTSVDGRACITTENTPRWHVRICSLVRICFLLAPSLDGGRGGWGQGCCFFYSIRNNIVETFIKEVLNDDLELSFTKTILLTPDNLSSSPSPSWLLKGPFRVHSHQRHPSLLPPTLNSAIVASSSKESAMGGGGRDRKGKEDGVFKYSEELSWLH